MDGNTIFLNELRNSLDSEYSNEDLYEAIKILSKYLIQLSKDSELMEALWQLGLMK